MTTRHPMTEARGGLTPQLSANAWPPYLSAALAVWLFISAFAWTHTFAVRTDTWVVAVLVFAASVWAIVTPVVRYANAVLAAWLFISTVAMSNMAPTVWNNVLVAIALFVLAFVSFGEARARTPTTPVNL